MSDLNSLEFLLRTGAISRRQFISRATALGLASALPLSMTAGSAQAMTPKKVVTSASVWVMVLPLTR